MKRRRSTAEMRLTDAQRALAADWYPILRPRLIPVAIAHGLDRTEAEEVVDYAIVSAAGSWTRQAGFPTYCDRVVQRHALNARARRPLAVAGLDGWAESIPGPIDDDDPPPAILEALEAIPPADRDLLWAWLVEGEPATPRRRLDCGQVITAYRCEMALKRAQIRIGHVANAKTSVVPSQR